MVLLDTHALIWWTMDPEKLSPKAKNVCESMEEKGGHISAISIWEIGIKIKNKKIDIGMSIEDYLLKLKTMNILEIVPVDEHIWIQSLMLDWENRDPADRVIVATAMKKDIPLLSKDKKMKKIYKKVIW